MNKRYDFTQTGGFPLDQGVLNDEQNDMIAIETALGNLVGPLVIISGCIVAGANAGNGVVMINGQLLPFVGGAISAKVIIFETDTELNYFDGTPRPSLITRVAKFGDDGIQNNPWASFVRVNANGILADLNTIEDAIATIGGEITSIDTQLANIEATYWQTGDVKQVDCSMDYLAANFDNTGLGKNSRVGWQICNGQRGTKDRSGTVAVQLDTTQIQFQTLGQPGGAVSYQIKASDLPALLLNQEMLGEANGGTSGLVQVGGKADNGQAYVNVGSPNNPISMLQPYIVTLFIQKL